MRSELLLIALLLLLIITMADSFDATDPKYQINAKFPPDKTATWTYGIEHDGWWIAHEALRGELADMQEILNNASSLHHLKTRQQIMALQCWWRGHLKHMHSHHRNEDKVAKKFASRRFVWPDFLEVDHEDILQRLENINVLIQKIVDCTTTNENDDDNSVQTRLIEELRTVWTDYHQVTAHHLDEEEKVCIALMRAYFTQQQVQRMQQRLAMMGPRVEAGGIVHYVGEQRMRESMKVQKTPKVMEVVGWNLILKPRHKYYMRSMVAHLETLRNANDK